MQPKLCAEDEISVFCGYLRACGHTCMQLNHHGTLHDGTRSILLRLAVRPAACICFILRVFHCDMAGLGPNLARYGRNLESVCSQDSLLRTHRKVYRSLFTSTSRLNHPARRSSLCPFKQDGCRNPLFCASFFFGSSPRHRDRNRTASPSTYKCPPRSNPRGGRGVVRQATYHGPSEH